MNQYISHSHIWIHIYWIHVYEFIYISIHMYEFIYIWIHIHMNYMWYNYDSYMKWLNESIISMSSAMKWIYEFMKIWNHAIKCTYSEFIYEFIKVWIQTYEFIVSNLNSWIWFHKLEFMIWIHYWKSRMIQYSEFMVLNSVVEYVIWIHFDESKIIITWISVMNPWLNWIFFNSRFWIHRRIHDFA